MESHGRVRPLSVQIGGLHLVLSSGDLKVLVDTIDRLVEQMLESRATGVLDDVEALQKLRQTFTNSSGSLADPPLRLDKTEIRLVRALLDDITGYRRGDLTPGLRQLRQLL